jgi:hypothetical protein
LLKPALIIGISVLLLIAASAVLVFTARPPLLIITDDEFTGIYGVLRTRENQLLTSLKLHRRVKAVRVSSGAGPDVIAFAADAAAKNPFGVIFPYRYYEGACMYAAQYPETPVTVQAGAVRSKDSEDDGVLYVETDKKTDFYRAGLCAAAFALHNQGNILFFQGNTVVPEDREAFIQGLRQQGYEDTPQFVYSSGEFQPDDNISCAVIAGAAVSFLSKPPAIPMIVFSWADPAITSQEVKILFDDSPWALAPQLVKAFEQTNGLQDPEPASLPSEITALRARIRDDELWQNIQKIINNKERYE